MSLNGTKKRTKSTKKNMESPSRKQKTQSEKPQITEQSHSSMTPNTVKEKIDSQRSAHMKMDGELSGSASHSEETMKKSSELLAQGFAEIKKRSLEDKAKGGTGRIKPPNYMYEALAKVKKKPGRPKVTDKKETFTITVRKSKHQTLREKEEEMKQYEISSIGDMVVSLLENYSVAEIKSLLSKRKV